MPATEVNTVCDQRSRTKRTRNIKLCSPHATLRVRKRSSSAVCICFENSAARTISAVGAVVGTRLLAVGCLGTAILSVNSHLIIGH